MEGNTDPSDIKAQAEKLLREGTGKKRLTAEDMEYARVFSDLTPTAKVAYLTDLLLKQLTGERDRLVARNNFLEEECAALRDSSVELNALKKTLVRDRWEVALTVIAMAIGGGLLSTYPKDDPRFAVGWVLIAIGAAWQVGKQAVIAIHDRWFSS